MISSCDRGVVVSSMGWVDHDSLWVFDAGRGSASTMPLDSGADWLSLHRGVDNRFAVGHHFNGGMGVRITVHDFAEPSAIIASAELGPAGSSFNGDTSVWETVPRLFVDYLGFGAWNEYVLLMLVAAENRVSVSRLAWYDDTYDHGYQGVIDVVECPGEQFAIVSVQRSSKLVMHDLDTGESRGVVELGPRGFGNPHPVMHSDRAELWADNYDSIAVVDTRTWRVRRQRRLQVASPGTQLFIGDFALSPDGSRCAVARPFAGDVVLLDSASLKVVATSTLGSQPLQVAVLADGSVIARDWKTGGLLLGKFRRKWFLG